MAVRHLTHGIVSFLFTLDLTFIIMDRREAWLLIPHPIRNLPADLATIIVLTAMTLVTVFFPIINETPLRIIFGLSFVLFLPGYAFIAALFPESGETYSQTEQSEPDSASPSSKPAAVPGTDAAATESVDQPSSTSHTSDSGIDGIERIALSFGLSIAIVPLIGLGLNFTPWGIRLAPIAITISAFTLGCVAIAARRRQQLPKAERFSVPYQTWIANARTELLEPEDRADVALNAMLALSILLAVGSVGYAVAVPSQGEQFSEFYLLTENSDGELVADDYPQELTRGDQAELIIGVENNEYRTTNYTVVIQLQETRQANNTTTVTSRTEIDRFGFTADHNETVRRSHTFAPTQTGEKFRVQYLLYTGDPPETPTQANAYRDLHIWIDVTDTVQ